jgi:DNA ligase D-like protein (predicted polymerase)/DNA ligase D-like protein (predicted 3'-phosphoesterase)
MPGKLADYRRKRDFAQTPEPKGAVAARNRSLRFVIQKHAARSLHYDFRLELDGTLKSWAIPKGPSLDPAQKRLAVHVEDHPLEYGNFEGVIPPGHYGAGKVEIWDSGVWQPLGNAADDYRAGKLKFRLDGEKLHGGWALVRTRLPASGDKEQWLLIKERDGTARPADEFNVTEAMPDAAHATVARKSRAIDNAAAGSRRPKTAGAAKVKAGSPNAKSGQVPVASKRASAKPARRPSEARESALPRKAAAREEVRNESVAGVTITHPQRIIDEGSGCTKLALARYYERVAPWILPHLADRPVALVRGPTGVQGELFFQKHAEHMKIPGIRKLDRKFDPEHPALMVIDSTEALIGAVQFGTIEFHTWNATTRAIERPDRMIFDLDPDPALEWKAVVSAANITREVLESLGLQSLVKTSGGRGLHVVVPLARRNDWEEVGDFAQAVARYLAASMPEHFSAKSGARNRVKKVFVDYLRNRRGASTVAAYSARARLGLPVSVPLAWSEAETTRGSWNIRSLPRRLANKKRDAWGAAMKPQALTAAMTKKLALLCATR